MWGVLPQCHSTLYVEVPLWWSMILEMSRLLGVTTLPLFGYYSNVILSPTNLDTKVSSKGVVYQVAGTQHTVVGAT